MPLDSCYDTIIVGGGPAGSSCATRLVRAGQRVLVVDRRDFPRVKPCAGWVSAPVWDALDLRPADYPHGLWSWTRCHVHFGGATHTIRARSWFIRRFEFDDFLLRRSRADVSLGTAVEHVEADDEGGWVVNRTLRSRFLVGAGGTHCPVARAVFPPKRTAPVGTQEVEVEAGSPDVARTRLGGDGEPEILLHDDLRGYSWNVPKTSWLNVGCGTADAKSVRGAWQRARMYFTGEGHVPESARDALDHVIGWSYFLFDPTHLADCRRGTCLLAGDALGLAQPVTAEGILPAVLSGRLAADAILANAPETYPARLARSRILRDYDLLRRLRTWAASRPSAPASAWRPSRIGRVAVAHAFARLFTGEPLPAGRALDLLARGIDRWMAPSSR